MIKGDFHVHSRFSDSSRDVEEVLKLADEKNLDYISITDHDTTETYDYIKGIKDNYKVHIIPGMEISGYDFERKRKVHLLAYKYKDNKNLKKIGDEMLYRRNEKSEKQVEKLISLGYKIDREKLKRSINSNKTLCKQHIMDYICEYEFNDPRYQKLYRKLFKNGGPLDIEMEYVDIKKALRAALDDKAITVIAHPGEVNSFEIAKELVGEGLMGIEVHHISHSKEDVLKAKEIAKKYNLIETSGSDNHGRYGKNSNLGYEISDESVLKELIDN